jgi:hypothetical protein
MHVYNIVFGGSHWSQKSTKKIDKSMFIGFARGRKVCIITLHFLLFEVNQGLICFPVVDIHGYFNCCVVSDGFQP